MKESGKDDDHSLNECLVFKGRERHVSGYFAFFPRVFLNLSTEFIKIPKLHHQARSFVDESVANKQFFPFLFLSNILVTLTI